MTNDTYLSEVDKLSAKKASRPRAAVGTDQPTTNAAPASGPVPTVALTVRVSEEQSNMLSGICARNGWSKTQAIKKAIALLENSNG